MTDTTQPTPQVNPLLRSVYIPGETFRLPSMGIFYNNGELSPDVKNGEVVVNPMTTMDEIIIKTTDKLLNGTAITEVFQRCIVGIDKPLELFSKDVDFLMLCLRKVTYGNEFDLPLTHDCENAQEHAYRVSLPDFITRTRSIDPTSINSLYTIKMENGQAVKLNPPRFGLVLSLYQSIAEMKQRSNEELQKEAFANLAGLIQSVDGVNDKEHIIEWLKQVPASFVDRINKKTEEGSNWGPEFSVSVNCKDCDKKWDVSIPLNPVSFFLTS